MESIVGLLALAATALIVVGGTVYVGFSVFKHSKGVRWIAAVLIVLAAASIYYYVYRSGGAPPDQRYATPDGRITFNGPPGVLIAHPDDNGHEVVYRLFRERTSRDKWNLDVTRTGPSDQTPPGMVHFMTIIEETNTQNPNIPFDRLLTNLVSGWIDGHNGHSPVTKEGAATINGMPARYVELRRDRELSTTYTVMYAIDAGTSYLTVIGNQPFGPVHDAVNTMRVNGRATTPSTPAP